MNTATLYVQDAYFANNSVSRSTRPFIEREQSASLTSFAVVHLSRAGIHWWHCDAHSKGPHGGAQH